MSRAIGCRGDEVLACSEVDHGTSDTSIDPEAITISYEEDVPLAGLESGDFGISVSLGDGPDTAHIATSDLTPEYVIFNGERS